MSLLQRADERLLLVFRRDLHRPSVARAAHALSVAGEHGLLWYGVAALGATADPDRRADWHRVGVSAFATLLTNVAIKRVVRRRRPQLDGFPPLMGTASGLSFPSAHTSTSFAAARAASGLVPRRPLYAAAAAMGLSRLLLGVHYPSDVVVGALLGWVLGTVGRR